MPESKAEAQARLWALVDEAVTDAKAIAYDGCHKIYVLLDDAEVKAQRNLGYGDGSDDSRLLMIRDIGVNVARKKLRDWFDSSCSLRFISSVRHVPDDPNAGFTRLIAQGEEAFFDEEAYDAASDCI